MVRHEEILGLKQPGRRMFGRTSVETAEENVPSSSDPNQPCAAQFISFVALPIFHESVDAAVLADLIMEYRIQLKSQQC